jgi:hypothetical protein
MGIVQRTPSGDEDMTAGPIGRHRVAVAGVWDWRPPKPWHHRRRCRLPAEGWPQVELTYRSAVRCPVLTKDVDGRASAGGSSESGSSIGRGRAGVGGVALCLRVGDLGRSRRRFATRDMRFLPCAISEVLGRCRACSERLILEGVRAAENAPLRMSPVIRQLNGGGSLGRKCREPGVPLDRLPL